MSPTTTDHPLYSCDDHLDIMNVPRDLSAGEMES